MMWKLFFVLPHHPTQTSIIISLQIEFFLLMWMKTSCGKTRSSLCWYEIPASCCQIFFSFKDLHDLHDVIDYIMRCTRFALSTVLFQQFVEYVIRIITDKLWNANFMEKKFWLDQMPWKSEILFKFSKLSKSVFWIKFNISI